MSVNTYYTIANPNALLAAGNYVDMVAATLSSTSNSLNPLFLLSNAQIANLYTFARIDNFGTVESNPTPEDDYCTAIYADLGKQRSIGLVGLLKTNITTQGNVRVMISDKPFGSGGTIVFDSGWLPANGSSPGFGGLNWGQFLWGDVTADSDLANFNRHTLIPLVPVIGRYVGFYIDDPTLPLGGLNTYIQFARFWISGSYQPTFNVSYGAEVQPIDETPVTRMQAGNREFGSTVIHRRQINVTFDDLTIAEVMANIVGPLFYKGGISGEVIIMLQPADWATVNYQSVYGTLPTVDKSVHQFWNRMGTTLSVEEQV